MDKDDLSRRDLLKAGSFASVSLAAPAALMAYGRKTAFPPAGSTVTLSFDVSPVTAPAPAEPPKNIT